MKSYLIIYHLPYSNFSNECIISAKNKTLAKIKFLKTIKHLIIQPDEYIIKEFK